jgi:hypothetical protein
MKVKVKLFLCLTKHHATKTSLLSKHHTMNIYEVEVYLHAFLTSQWIEVSSEINGPAALIPLSIGLGCRVLLPGIEPRSSNL